MQLTDEQKYNAVLKELGEVLTSKNTTINCQRWQIDQLKEKLKAAEAERDRTLQDIADVAAHRVCDLDAVEQLRSVNKALRKCVNMENKTIVDFEGLLDLQQYIQTALQVLETGGAA